MDEIRLIDANSLMKHICGHECGCNPEECGGMESKTVPCNFYAYVNEAPTIEAEPVKHGKWIEKPPYKDETVKGLEFQIVCSECDGQNSNIVFNDAGEITGKDFWMSRFCPHCGAKMDG